jgi:hypothetical protein
MNCEKIIKFKKDDGAFESWLYLLTSKSLTYVDYDVNDELDYNMANIFSENTYNRIIKTIKNNPNKCYKTYIYQDSKDYNENLNIAPVDENITVKTVVIEYGLDDIIVYLNPEIDNPNLMRFIEENDISKVSKEFINELSAEVSEKVLEKFNNFALNIINAKFTEDEINTIFKNLSNSAMLNLILSMTPEFFQSVKLLSEDSKSLIEKLSYTNKIEESIQGYEKIIEDFETRINNLENRTDDVEEDILDEINTVNSYTITPEFIENLIADPRFMESLEELIVAKIEEKQLDN